MLNDTITTRFGGFALAPLNVQAARSRTSTLITKHGEAYDAALKHLEPHYLNDDVYRPRGWRRSLHLVPAAAPRSSYSKPLAGGESQKELAPDMYHQLARDPKKADEMPFFSDRVPPQSGDYQIVDRAGDGNQCDSPPALVWERLVPLRPSRRSDAKVILAAHGLGFYKETFLPLLDRLIAPENEDHGIAQAWLVDALGHGMTAVYNSSTIRVVDASQLLSCQHRIVDSNDYARDMLQFLLCYLPATPAHVPDLPTVLPYHEPRLPPSPLIGLGHSFGATSLMQLCVHLPERVFESLCVIEPILVREPLVQQATRIPLARFTLMKPDEWSSRTEASQSFAKDRMLSVWDPRVRSAYVAGGLFPIHGYTEQEGKVQRCCDRVSEALCIRGNRPGIQLATHTLAHIPSNVKVLYVSCAKPLLLPLDEVEQTAKSSIPQLVFRTLKGSHSLPLESPDAVADLICCSLISVERESKL